MEPGPPDDLPNSGAEGGNWSMPAGEELFDDVSEDAGNQSYQGRTVALLAGVEAAGKAASFVMFMAATRLMSVEDFGLFSWALSLSLLPVAFAVWGFGTTVIQRGSVDLPAIPSLLSEAVAWRLILGIPAVGLLALPIWGNPQYRLGLVLVGVASLADTFNELVRGAAGAMMRQRAVALNLLAQRIVVSMLVTVALMRWPNPTVMAAAYCMGTLVGVAAMFVSGARIGLRPRLRLITRVGMGRMWRDSHAVGGAGLLNTVIFRSDTVLLAWLSTMTATGIYAAAYRLFESGLFVLWALIRVSIPKMAATRSAETLNRLVFLVPVAAMSILMPYITVLAVRGGDVLTLVFGTQYKGIDAALTMAILGVTLAPYTLQFLHQSALISRSLNRPTLVGSASALIVNLSINLVLIPIYGAQGAAVATLIAMCVQWLYLGSQVRRGIGAVNLWHWMWPTIAAGMAMVPVLLAMPSLLAAFALSVLVYLGVWALLHAKLRPNVYALALRVAGRA